MKKAARPQKIVRVDGLVSPDWLLAVDRAHPVLGLGIDVGTTTNKTSNPSVLSVCQRVGWEYRWPLIVRLKSKDPAVTAALIDVAIRGLAGIGLRLRRGAIDATSEKYFAVAIRKAFAGRLPFDLIVSSETLAVGGERMNWKAYLGDQMVNTVEDGYAALPTAPWVKMDLRSVVKEKGLFAAEILEDGGHGDVFDSCKLSLHAVMARGGPAEIRAAGVGAAAARVKQPRPGLMNPRAQEVRGLRPFGRAR